MAFQNEINKIYFIQTLPQAMDYDHLKTFGNTFQTAGQSYFTN